MISRLNESKRESDCCLFAAPEARPLHYRPAKTMLVQLRGRFVARTRVDQMKAARPPLRGAQPQSMLRVIRKAKEEPEPEVGNDTIEGRL
jgi:hypothetical protein